jgi:hypothetical protein
MPLTCMHPYCTHIRPHAHRGTLHTHTTLQYNQEKTMLVLARANAGPDKINASLKKAR